MSLFFRASLCELFRKNVAGPGPINNASRTSRGMDGRYATDGGNGNDPRAPQAQQSDRDGGPARMLYSLARASDSITLVEGKPSHHLHYPPPPPPPLACPPPLTVFSLSPSFSLSPPCPSPFSFSSAPASPPPSSKLPSFALSLLYLCLMIYLSHLVCT